MNRSFDPILSELGNALIAALDGLTEAELDEIEQEVAPLISYLEARTPSEHGRQYPVEHLRGYPRQVLRG